MKKKAPETRAVVDTLKASLLESGLVTIASTDTEPPLVSAASSGDLARVRVLLAAGDNPNAANKANRNKDNFLGEPPLVHAVRRGHIAIAEALLKAGANPNYKPLGRSLLAFVIWERKFPCVKLLLRYGAKPVASRRGVPSPLEACIDRAAADTFSLLVQHGADACGADSSGGCLLSRALFAYKNAVGIPAHAAKLPALRNLAREASSMLLIIREILRHQPDVNKSDRDGITPLMPAAAAAPVDVIQNLLKLGANLEAEIVSKHKQAAGWRAIHFAVTHNRADAVKCLITAGANVTKALPDGTDLIHFAERHSSTNVIEYFRTAKTALTKRP
jgi:ankyrin repeat protein